MFLYDCASHYKKWPIKALPNPSGKETYYVVKVLSMSHCLPKELQPLYDVRIP